MVSLVVIVVVVDVAVTVLSGGRNADGEARQSTAVWRVQTVAMTSASDVTRLLQNPLHRQLHLPHSFHAQNVREHSVRRPVAQHVYQMHRRRQISGPGILGLYRKVWLVNASTYRAEMMLLRVMHNRDDLYGTLE